MTPARKITIHYVLENGQDGSASVSFHVDRAAAETAGEIQNENPPAFYENVRSEDLYFDDKGVLLNPAATRAQVERSMAEASGEAVVEAGVDAYDQKTKAMQLAKTFNAVVVPDLDKITLYYVIENHGGGEAGVSFYADAETAELAGKVEEEKGEQPFEQSTFSKDLYFDASGVLLNPVATPAQLARDLAEARGEDVPEAEAPEYQQYEQEWALSRAFEKAAILKSGSLAGKTVVFTGKLSTGTRAEAEALAIQLGACVTKTVSNNTDVVIAGAGAGDKLQRAADVRAIVMDEAEWEKLIGAGAKTPSRQAPRGGQPG